MSLNFSAGLQDRQDMPASPRGQPTLEIATLFPLQGCWSEERYLSLDTNRLIELREGCLEVLPMTTLFHQAIAQFLYKLLDRFVEDNRLGEAFIAPLRVRLWEGEIREPDVVFLRTARIGDRKRPPDGADLVMEVVSEGTENRRRDLEKKRVRYAQAGIAEYWIVDDQTKSITVLALADKDDRVHGVFGVGTEAISAVLSGFQVSVDAAFAAGEGRR